MAVAQPMFFDGSAQLLGQAFGKAAFQILLGVEQREDAFFPCQLHRRGISRIAHGASY